MEILKYLSNIKNIEFKKEKIISLILVLVISSLFIGVGTSQVASAETTNNITLENSEISKKSSEPCFGLNSDISLSANVPFQTVQSVWVDDPKWGKTPNPHLPKTWGDMLRTDINDYQIILPMVKGKKTKLFLWNRKSYNHLKTTGINGQIANGYPEQKQVKLKISSENPNFEYLTKTFTLPAAQTDPDDDCNDASGVDVSFKIPNKGLPEEPFELNQNRIKIKTELVTAGGSPVSDSIPENDESTTTIDITPVKTIKLNILYVPVKLANTRGVSQSKVNRLSRHSTEFIKGAFPVDEDKVKRNVSTNTQEFGLKPFSKDGVERQLRRIFRQLSAIGSVNGYDKVVGVTRKDSFGDWWGNHTNFSDTTAGLSFPNNHIAVLSTVENPNSPVHEIGHTYGLYTGNSPEEYQITSPGHEANGFWVQKEKNMDGKVSFMGTFVNPGTDYSKDHWIDKPDYEQLLKKFQNLDPKILFLTGSISKSGDANLGRLYKLKGSIDKTLNHTGGNYSIVFKNQSGVLNSTTFNVSFGLDGGSSGVDIQFDSAPFAFRVPWVNGTDTVQLKNKKGEVIAEKTVSSHPPKIDSISVGNSTVSWMASDPDGDSLTYDVFVGTSGKWNLLRFNTKGNNINVDSNLLSKYSKLKVIANDGMNTNEKIVDIDTGKNGNQDDKKDENQNGNQSIIDLYNVNNKNGIEGDEVRPAIKCFLFGNNACMNNNQLSGTQVRKVIKSFLFG